ncbi:MAG: hypothetical protein EXR99_08985 [Gemmataceae bacterium]|nr:hypothetical protein [Gemmataceae bacterium]
MRSALVQIPWVVPNSIVGLRDKETVRFAVQDKEKFNLEELKKVVSAKAGSRYQVTRVIQ